MSDRLDISAISQVDIRATDAISTSATQNAQALEVRVGKLVSAIDDALANERAEREQTLAKLPVEQRTQLKKIEERVWSDRRRELTAATMEANQADVEKQMRDLAEQKQKLETIRDLLGPDPAHYVTTLGLTSDSIGPYLLQVQSMQPGALAQAARVAISQNNIALGAAIIGRLSEMKADARPFPVNKLAFALVGEDWQRRTDQITLALDRVQDGQEAAARFLVGRSARPLEKIQRGLRDRARQEGIDRQALGRAVSERSGR